MVLTARGQQPATENASPPGVTAPGTAQPHRITEGVTKGELIKRVNPKYPRQARKKHIEGVVVLTATIGKEGAIANLELVSGDPLLAQAAMDAVKQWKYRPYRLFGQLVEVKTNITVNFELSHR